MPEMMSLLLLVLLLKIIILADSAFCFIVACINIKAIRAILAEYVIV